MRLQPNRNYVSNDDIQMPRELARRLVDHSQPTGRILLPYAGDGAFLHALRARARVPLGGATCPQDAVPDLSSSPQLSAPKPQDPTRIPWCDLKKNRDFFTWQQPVDWIITNPPWSQIRRFLQHAVSLADHVVFLFTINHLWTRAPLGDVKAAGFARKEIVLVDTPETFPPSGFQLGAVHLQRGWTGPVKLTDWTAPVEAVDGGARSAHGRRSDGGSSARSSTSTPPLQREKSGAGPAQPGLDPLLEDLRALNRQLDTLLSKTRN